jgi:class 3 adenylate cyclase
MCLAYAHSQCAHCYCHTACLAPLGLQVGLDVGPASHTLGATSGRLEYRGKVMNRAARIAGHASAGHVVCSTAVWRAAEEYGGLSADVMGLSLGPVELKGVAAGMEVINLVRQPRRTFVAPSVDGGLRITPRDSPRLSVLLGAGA